MIVEQQRGECRGIDTELQLIGNLSRELRIERMNTLYHQYLTIVQAQFLTTPLALAGLEVIAWQLNLLATEERSKLLVEQGYVQRMDALKVVIARLVARCLLTIQEIIVERDRHRLDAIGDELHRQALAGGGLTR